MSLMKNAKRFATLQEEIGNWQQPDSVPHYTLQKGLLRYKKKLVIGNNPSLRTSLLKSFHASELGGHSGEKATYHRLKLMFHWT